MCQCESLPLRVGTSSATRRLAGHAGRAGPGGVRAPFFKPAGAATAARKRQGTVSTLRSENQRHKTHIHVHTQLTAVQPYQGMQVEFTVWATEIT